MLLSLQIRRRSRGLTGLRQLILLLCQQSRISTLCSLPLSGARVVQRQGRSAALITIIMAVVLSNLIRREPFP